ncbi:Pentatricopeptide repeat [Macleaya cordata]|uniref:Pentatricopeptide repeat n=1 Tax=Macleaya cordata TaxID=56857 RepID=A0A200QF02_MACCD|nr:Pentatricopeptide repeat [Macleaya cordata]
MLKGYSDNEFYEETMVLFNQMKSRDVRPNCFTFPFVIKSCKMLLALGEGKKVHCFVIKSGFEMNRFISIAMIDMYSTVGAVKLAHQVFDGMPERNIVAWTAIISGYILSADIKNARRLFEITPDRDVIIWNIMISGYISNGDMVTARKLFNEMPNRDLMAFNTILIGYFNNENFEEGEKFFDEMTEKNVFSWNGLIGGYARKGRFSEVLGAFKRMLKESSDIPPNDATLVSVLTACSRLGALALGKWVHVYAVDNGYKQNIYVGNGLIDMYSKCGNIENAIEVFNCMNSKDLITWNSIIGGLAMHGRGNDALIIFDQMRNANKKPDGITFVGVLCACTHMGLTEKGFSYFNLMTEDYSIVPEIEHFGCMADLLARAGFLNEAVDYIRKMPIQADAVIWSALLGACRTYRNIQLAEIALEKLIELEPKNPANYIMLSNIYKDMGRWEDVARLKVAMKETGVRKPTGCSLIEVNDGVTEFYSLDEKHPQREEIYRVLNGLVELLKSPSYDSGIDELEEGYVY